MKNKLSATAFTATATTLVTLFTAPVILFSSLLTTQNAIAETVSVDDKGGLQLSITANRRAQAIDKTLAAVTVITKEDIQKYKAIDLPDVLRHIPGVSIKYTGGAGKATSIFIRGASSSQVLVLVDGIKMNSATLGRAAIQHVPISQIERIEIVRGPRSGLYGSEAIGGVIQIFTKKGAKQDKVALSIGVGSNKTRNSSVSLSTSANNSWLNLSASEEKTDGINSREPYSVYGLPAPVNESDRDGYRRDTVNFGFGHEFDNGYDAHITLLESHGKTQFDGSSQNETSFKQRVISSKVSGPINNKVKLSATIGTALDDKDNFKDGVAASNFTTNHKSASVQADIKLKEDSTVILGIDWQKDKVSGSTDYSVKSRINKAVFASYQGLVDKNRFEVSLRRDNNEQFGNKVTGSFSVGHEFTNGLLLSGTFGTAFKAPTFNDLYYPSSGNADLKPEKSKNYEIGLSKSLVNGNLGLRIFKNNISQMINWAPAPTPTKPYRWSPSNIDSVNIEGVELEIGKKVMDWDVKANTTYLQAKSNSGFNKGKYLTYRPRQALNIDVSRKIGKLRLGSNLHAENKRYTDSANTDKLGGFTTVDVYADYQIAKDWSVGAKISNLLDKEYQSNKGYHQDEINGLLTVNYSPK